MKLLFYILIVSISFQSIAKIVCFADFLINNKYISEVLCINKDNPDRNCNGKCHLVKMMENHDAGDEHSKNRISQKETEFKCCMSVLKSPNFALAEISLIAECKSGVLNNTITEVFHPPKSFQLYIIT